ncbi:hypothetical protein [Kitasatospora sp. NPDC057223]|uniref:hypothetical protein n=1 Tax=Kitasatospora sp. NPDC057223 TaxID=3346055 RepID=UPI00362E5F15
MDVWAPPGAVYGPGWPVEAAETPEERRVRVRRRRMAAVRWGAAVLVLGLVGVEAAVAVTTMDRTDLPGLATPADGRYSFPTLVLPPLPSGKPAPSADGRSARHHADLRSLLLPAPKEAVAPAATAGASTAGAATAAASATAATATATASGTATATATAVPVAGPTPGEWVACDALADDQRDPVAVKAVLAENACRAAAVREWTAKDGTRTQIRLLHFGSADEASAVSRFIWTAGAPKLEGLQTDPAKDFDTVVGVASMVRSNGGGKPGAPATARVGYLVAGDVVAVIEMTNPQDVPAPAFRQVVTLQSDLLA